MWSLGVMAFELLTGKPALSMLEGKDKVGLFDGFLFALFSPQCSITFQMQ